MLKFAVLVAIVVCTSAQYVVEPLVHHNTPLRSFVTEVKTPIAYTRHAKTFKYDDHIPIVHTDIRTPVVETARVVALPKAYAFNNYFPLHHGLYEVPVMAPVYSHLRI